MPNVFQLRFSREAASTLKQLERLGHTEKKLRKVRRTLGNIQRDPRHPGLNSHEFHSIKGVNGERVWESYVENRTAGAWRIFWHYGPGRSVITILTISEHP